MTHNFKLLLALLFLSLMASCQEKKTAEKESPVSQVTQNIQVPGIEQVVKSEEEWKEELSKEEYHVLRKAGTERSFTGDLWDHKEDGIYTCRGCGLDLFDSKTKFKSGTGWPSYYEPIDSVHVAEDTDHILGYARTEVHCARCQGHLGHVFPDGPDPTGLRYCINSVSLDFKKRETTSP